MKLKNLFLGSFALTAMLFAQSCDDKNDGPTGAPSIELSTQTLDFEKDGGSKTIKLTATRDWNVTNVPDWIAVDPKSGNPAENKEVTITVLANDGAESTDRTETLSFSIGFDSKSLVVNQKGLAPSPNAEGTIKHAISLGKDKDATIENVIVVGLTTKSFVVSDATGKMLVFANGDPGLKIGDKVNVSGKTEWRNGFIQITSPTTTKVSEGNEVIYPEPKVIDESNMETYSSEVVEYVTFVGNVRQSGQYYNVYVGSITSKDISLPYYIGGIESFVDKDIEVKGWYVGGQNHYQVVATDVKEVASTGPKFSVSTTALTAKAGDTSASFDVKGNVKWTVSSDNAAYTVSPASGEGAGTVTVKFAANETEKDVTVKLTVSTTEEVATKSYTVTLTHKGKSAAGEGEAKTITIATDNAWSKDTHETYKAGFSFTKDGVKYGYYQSSSTSTMVAPSGDHIRVYKNAVLEIVPPAGKTITSVVMNTVRYADKCVNMKVLGSETEAVADTKAFTISWSGNLDKFVAQAVNGQVRITAITVTLK